MSPISRLIYLLFGVAALYEIIFYRVIQRRWDCKPWPAAAETRPVGHWGSGPAGRTTEAGGD